MQHCSLATIIQPSEAVGASALVAVALLISWGLARLFEPRHALDAQRVETIDGLRGFLAMLVVVHHSAGWIGMAQDDGWLEHTSNFIQNAGHVPVCIFFMVTSFLFWGRASTQKDRPIDWKRFFVARVFRLYPSYLVMVALLVTLVFSLTGWEMRTSSRELAGSIGAWVLFTAPGMPQINGVDITIVLTAGVVWSLVWEWAFYFALPVLSVIFVPRPGIWLVVPCALLSGLLLR